MRYEVRIDDNFNDEDESWTSDAIEPSVTSTGSVRNAGASEPQPQS